VYLHKGFDDVLANVTELFEELNFDVGGNLSLKVFVTLNVVGFNEGVDVVDGECSLCDSFLFLIFFSSM
jgi:hypothetical protein